MYCSQCGTEIPNSSKFCSNCGASLESALVAPTSSEPVLTKQNQEEKLVPTLRLSDFLYAEGDYALAQIRSEKDNSFFFMCADEKSNFFLSKDLLSSLLGASVNIGDYIWVSLTEKTNEIKNRYRVRVIRPAIKPFRNLIEKEFLDISNKKKVGDYIYGQISGVQDTKIIVSLAPNLKGVLYKKDLPDSISEKDLKIGVVKSFRIKDVQKDSNSISLLWDNTSRGSAKYQSLWSRLPQTLDGIFILPKTWDAIREYNNDCNIFLDTNSEAFDQVAFLRVMTERFIKIRAEKRVVVQELDDKILFEFDTGFRSKKGAPLSACFKYEKKDPNPKWKLNLFGFTNASRTFDLYVNTTKDMQKHLDALALMALSGEEWDYVGENESGKKYILRQYLRFSFFKSLLDGLIVEDPKTGSAVFNTGLVDAAYDEIYCFLVKNTDIDDYRERKWEIGFFACWGKGTNGKKLHDMFSSHPSAPQYIDPERIEDIYYNIDKELFCDYDHIIGDNISRLPISFIQRKLSYDSKAVKLAAECTTPSNATAYDQLKKYIKNNETLLRDLVDGLKNAVEVAKKHCKWNYKTAIPTYYPRNNSVSLLLPLCLSNDNSRADAALVIERLDNGNYQGQTILTLEMAYLDARQICRPNSEWLTVEKITRANPAAEDSFDF